MNIADAQLWLRDQQLSLDGVTMTYARGATTSAITSLQGRSEWETDSYQEQMVQSDTVDFFVLASEIAAIGTPASGDTITLGTTVFQVMNVGGGKSWQWADEPNRTTYRIHTRAN